MSEKKKKFDLQKTKESMHKVWTRVWSTVASNPKVVLACVFISLATLAGTLILVFQLRNSSPETKGMCRQQVYVTKRKIKSCLIYNRYQGAHVTPFDEAQICFALHFFSCVCLITLYTSTVWIRKRFVQCFHYFTLYRYIVGLGAFTNFAYVRNYSK